MLIVNNFPRGIMDDFYFLSLSLSLFLVSVFCGEHVLCDKKEKVGIDKYVWSRVLRTQVPVAAPDAQDSVSLAQPTCWGLLHLGPSPPVCAQCSPVLPAVSPTFSLPPCLESSLVMAGYILLFTQEE